MARFLVINEGGAANALRKMFDQGKASLLYERSLSVDRGFVLGGDGSTQGVVGGELTAEFVALVKRYPAGDGLMPGFSQTACKTPATA